MAFQRFLRGSVPWPTLEGAIEEVLARHDVESARVEFPEADNWLSTPCVINGDLFVKVISRQNSLVHALFTAGRNLGAFSSGTEGFFEHFATPMEMAEHELDANRQMRELGLNAPEPKDAFEFEDVAVIVLEYLPEFQTLEEVPTEQVPDYARDLFRALETMHDAQLAHGDLQGENVLISRGELYFIDATKVREGGIEDARWYDTACALAALEPLVGARKAVAAALEVHDPEELLVAEEFLDFVNMRPEHDFDAAGLKGEIEKHAS